jgi:hypothetical protein
MVIKTGCCSLLNINVFDIVASIVRLSFSGIYCRFGTGFDFETVKNEGIPMMTTSGNPEVKL